ncbi:MAG: FHA domain-containing protein [Dysosmobacter sp.]
MQELFSALSLWLSAHPLITGWYTAIARLLFPVLSALILVRAIRSLLRIPHTPEVWAQLSLPGGGSIPLTHWENILGRGKSADAILNYPSISRQHAALCRGEDGAWTVYDLGSKGGTAVNGTPVTEQAPVKLGDTLTLGGVPLVFLPQTVGEREELEKKRQAERPAAMWPSFVADGISDLDRHSVNIGGGGEGQPGDPHLLPDPHGGHVALRRRAAAGPLRGL